MLNFAWWYYSLVHDGIRCWTLPSHSALSDLDQISRSQWYQFENLSSYLIKLKLCWIVKYVQEIMNIRPFCCCFNVRTFKGDNDIFHHFEKNKRPLTLTDLTKALTLAFSWKFLRVALQILHDYNIAWGLPIYTMVDDLDLVSRSHAVLGGRGLMSWCFVPSQPQRITSSLLDQGEGGVFRGFSVVWLLHALKRSSRVCFVWLAYI